MCVQNWTYVGNAKEKELSYSEIELKTIKVNY